MDPEPLNYTTMSCASFGASTIPKPDAGRFVVKETNRVSDIEGTTPKSYYRSPQRENQWQKDDIFGTHSIKMHQPRSNYEDKSLMIDDIEGTRPKRKQGMCATKRHVDPLNPNYALPSYTPAPFEQTKSHPEPPEIVAKIPKRVIATKNTNNIDDIAGSKPGWRPRHVQARYDASPYPLMEVGDISAQTNRYIDRTSRVTNSLDPVYKINSEVIDVQFKPTQAKKYIPDNHQLQTRDVAGAYSGWIARPIERREFTNTNFVGDIEGAQADSIKHGITTRRELHPLLPFYPSLDGDILPPCTTSVLPIDKFNQPKLVQSPIKPTSSRAPLSASMTSFSGSMTKADSSASGNLFSPVRTPNGNESSRIRGNSGGIAGGGGGGGGMSMSMSMSMNNLEGVSRTPTRALSSSQTLDRKDSLTLAMDRVRSIPSSSFNSPQITGGRSNGGSSGAATTRSGGGGSSRGPGPMLSPTAMSRAAYQEMVADIAAVRALS